MAAFPISDRLRARFFERRMKEIEEFQSALTNEDWDWIRLTGHSLKGSGAMYGYPDITACGTRIEQGAIARDQAECAAAIEQLQKTLRNLHPSVIASQHP